MADPSYIEQGETVTPSSIPLAPTFSVSTINSGYGKSVLLFERAAPTVGKVKLLYRLFRQIKSWVRHDCTSTSTTRAPCPVHCACSPTIRHSRCIHITHIHSACLILPSGESTIFVDIDICPRICLYTQGAGASLLRPTLHCICHGIHPNPASWRGLLHRTRTSRHCRARCHRTEH